MVNNLGCLLRGIVNLPELKQLQKKLIIDKINTLEDIEVDIEKGSYMGSYPYRTDYISLLYDGDNILEISQTIDGETDLVHIDEGIFAESMTLGYEVYAGVFSYDYIESCNIER